MLKGKRTALVALALMVLGAVQGFDWATIIDNPATVGWVVSGIGIAMFALRAITDSPMFKLDG